MLLLLVYKRHTSFYNWATPSSPLFGLMLHFCHILFFLPFNFVVWRDLVSSSSSLIFAIKFATLDFANFAWLLLLFSCVCKYDTTPFSSFNNNSSSNTWSNNSMFFKVRYVFFNQLSFNFYLLKCETLFFINNNLTNNTNTNMTM